MFNYVICSFILAFSLNEKTRSVKTTIEQNYGNKKVT